MKKTQLAWEDDDGARRAFSAIHHKGDAFEYRILRPHGRRTWWSLTGSPELVPEPLKLMSAEECRERAQQIEDQMLADLRKERP